MIVVDTNILAYLYLPTNMSEKAAQLLAREPEWVAPVLWRSELRNVLALYLRQGTLTFEQSCGIQAEAEALMAGAEYDVSSVDVLQLVQRSECSAYDCEFVALAQQLGTRLVTADKKILRQFPHLAITLASAVA